jgi:hypothetical protein
MAIGLADGKIRRTFKYGADAPKFEVGGFPSLGFTQPAGKRIAFYSCDEDRKRHQVSVIDLESWSEVARFDSPVINYRVDLRVAGDLVVGVMSSGKEGVPDRIFSVDIAGGQLYSLPVRGGHGRGGAYHVLADGSRWLPEGRINPRCGYQRPWPKAGASRLTGGGLFLRDELGVCRLDPADGRELWRTDLPYYWMATLRSDRPCDFHAASDQLFALTEQGLIYVLSAADGKLRAVIRAITPSSMKRGHHGTEMLTAWDSERIYFSGLDGLRVYSARAVDAARPDPGDCGDPASYLARCRAALAAGDGKRAFEEVRGLGGAIALRPAMRREAAQLLSQLARSQAARLNPKLWQEVMLADGPLAGDLFVAEYAKEVENSSAAVAALIRVGTPRALGLAGKLSPGRYKSGRTMPLALEAIRKRTGARPVEQAAATPGLKPSGVLSLLVDGALDDATFRRRLPTVRRCVPTEPLGRGVVPMSWGRCLRFLTPEQVVAVLEGSKRVDAVSYREACREQAESAKNGEGRKEAVKVEGTPPKKKPPEVF